MIKIILLVLALLFVFFKVKYFSPSPVIAPTPKLTPTSVPIQTPVVSKIVEPVAEFKSRITKKFFGTYVTPQNSPISPERFTGYHTGVDVEYQDISTDVPVVSIADGVVVTSRYASGYGGVVVIKHQLDNQTLFSIYGHLRPSSLTTINTTVSKGEQIALLGTGYSSETDNERRHLHFGIAKENTLRGYVSTKQELNADWIDPLSLYN